MNFNFVLECKQQFREESDKVSNFINSKLSNFNKETYFEFELLAPSLSQISFFILQSIKIRHMERAAMLIFFKVINPYMA